MDQVWSGFMKSVWLSKSQKVSLMKALVGWSNDQWQIHIHCSSGLHLPRWIAALQQYGTTEEYVVLQRLYCGSQHPWNYNPQSAGCSKLINSKRYNDTYSMIKHLALLTDCYPKCLTITKNFNPTQWCQEYKLWVHATQTNWLIKNTFKLFQPKTLFTGIRLSVV